MNSEQPLVSIVIPVYNGANYLAEAIDSALAQTYPNVEVIVVNDGSNDDSATEKIAHSYGDRIHYFAKENGGVATALNLGIEKMRGEYFSWLSHDDFYLPEKIKAQVDHFLSMREKNVILWGDYSVVNEKGEIVEIRKREGATPSGVFYDLFYGHINGCTLLIPKTCFDSVGVFDPRYRATQDYDLWCRMAKVFEFRHLPSVQVSYRVHSAQDTRIKTASHRQEEAELYIRCMKMLSPENIEKMEERPSIFYMKMAERFREMLPEVSSFALHEFMRSSLKEPTHIIMNSSSFLRFHFHPAYLGVRKFLRVVKHWVVRPGEAGKR